MIVSAVEWSHPDSERLRAQQQAEISARYGSDTEPGPKPTGDDITAFFVAYTDDGTAAGCGGLRRIDGAHGEIKRMFVHPLNRGTGVSTAILARLESEARSLGWNRLVLETGEAQPDAVRFYEREGYVPIPKFGHYVHSEISLCFGKTL